MTAEGGECAGRRVKVAKLQYIHRAWAPYFFGGTTPEQVMRLTQQLTQALVTESQKEVAAPLERWCAVSCVCSGIVGNLHMRSKNSIAWVLPAGVLDRTLVRWSARKMSPYVTVAPMMATMFPPMMAGNGVSEVLVPMLAGPPVYEPRNKDKVYSPFEHERIWVLCGLSPENYDASGPPSMLSS
jgi:hypothetical protein